jgi:pSer/pThr/pTyr-binding forkhead associated (FHA) protein
VISESFVSRRHCEIKYINGKDFNLHFIILKTNLFNIFECRATIKQSKKS